MKTYIILGALLLSAFNINFVWAQACETWSEIRDGRVVLCQRCGSSVFCN